MITIERAHFIARCSTSPSFPVKKGQYRVARHVCMDGNISWQ
jgi:hypothetical protein